MRPTTRKGREKGPICGAKAGSGHPCKNPAGHGTDHPGEGRCKFHGGVGQVKGTRFEVGRYGDLKARPRLRELIAKFQADASPNDLLHEITMLRALVQDYVERYDEMSEAVLAWHASFDREFTAHLDVWREDVARYMEETESTGQEPERSFPKPPLPETFIKKPRQLIDITAAAGLISQIGAMSDRIEKRQREGRITLTLLDQALECMGMEVVYATKEVGIDDVTRTALLAVIDRRWNAVRIDPASGTVQGAEASGRGSLN